MTTLYTTYTRTFAAAFAAVVIVGLSGLTLDRGHLGATPAGSVEIGELQTLSVGDIVTASLPAIVVSGRRAVQLADRQPALADTRG